MKRRSRPPWNAKARSWACPARSRCSGTRRRENLLERAYRDAFVYAADVKRIRADEGFRLFARAAVHYDQRAGARALRATLERPAERDARGVGIEKLSVCGAMRVAQPSRVRPVETDDGVHGKVGFSENDYG